MNSRHEAIEVSGLGKILPLALVPAAVSALACDLAFRRSTGDYRLCLILGGITAALVAMACLIAVRLSRSWLRIVSGVVALIAVLAVVLLSGTLAGDWPMYRGIAASDGGSLEGAERYLIQAMERNRQLGVHLPLLGYRKVTPDGIVIGDMAYVYLLLSETYYRKGDYDHALWYCERAVAAGRKQGYPHTVLYDMEETARNIRAMEH